MSGGDERISVAASLARPLVGLGAAAEFFLRRPARHLSAQLIIPEHAAVANAVGAVTSLVHVCRRGSIVPSPDGTFLLSGVAGGLKFSDFDEAHHRLVEILSDAVRVAAVEAGTAEDSVALSVDDRIGTTADGAEVFLERSVAADIVGTPDLGVRVG